MDIPHPKKPETLPKSLNTSEIAKIIEVAEIEKKFMDIPHPKKPETLPKSLNTSEIAKIIEVAEIENIS